MRCPETIRAGFLLLLLLLAPGCKRAPVLVVGIDGGVWEVIDVLVEAGKLPTIGALLAEGVRSDFDCTPAMPSTACFCPPVWNTIATGQPESVHGMRIASTPSPERRVKAIWDVLREHGGETTTLDVRNTWPPEANVSFSLTQPGSDYAAHQLFRVWPAAADARGDEAELRTKPPFLLEALWIGPSEDPPPSWGPMARDRVALQTLSRLSFFHRSDLTALLFHSTDKSQHIDWGIVQASPDLPLDRDVLVARAEAWKGPVHQPGPWGFGTVVSQYLELDAWLGRLLARVDYPYVVLVSDHGMTRNRGSGLAGDHGPAAPEAHRGIFALRGPGVRRGVAVDAVSVFDVAPTLAYVLHLPVPDDLPGRVVVEAFEPEWLAWVPVERTPSWE